MRGGFRTQTIRTETNTLALFVSPTEAERKAVRDQWVKDHPEEVGKR